MKKTRYHLVIGYGEVGKGLAEVLEKFYRVDIYDPKSYPYPPGECEVIHICFPYSKNFSRWIKTYRSIFKPKLVIVHSTVPVGTCDKLGVVHSPIRGQHPHLAKGIRTFVKYFGGKNASKAADVFKDLGIDCIWVTKASWTEALKLWDTTQYGWQIVLSKAIWEWCKEHKIPFELIYDHANGTYNEGYTKLGRPEVVRPRLRYMPGPIGGHCVVPNLGMLLDTLVSKVITRYNTIERRRRKK